VSLIVFLEFWRILCLAGTNQKNRKRMKSRRLQKPPELNVTWHPRKKHLEEAKTHPAEVGPEGGNHRPIDPMVGPVSLPRAARQPYFWNVLPPPMMINLNRMLGRFDCTTHGIPSGLYKQPPDPLAGRIWLSSIHTPDQVIKSEILRPRNTL
jgi:hypothetical protein